MAKSKADAGPRTNKSEAVRGVLSQTPHATSKEIIAVLAEKGIKVSPTMVYYVRSKQIRRLGGPSANASPSRRGCPVPRIRSRL